MPDLIGLITTVEDFLGKKNSEIRMRIDHAPATLVKLPKDRVYVIPDYQREIRWKKEHFYKLMTDIARKPKFLGNIILNEKISYRSPDGEIHARYDIIDGQQRITMFLMLCKYLNSKLGRPDLPLIEPCGYENESFSMFNQFMGADFDIGAMEDLSVLEESDKLNQRFRYKLLWDSIEEARLLETSHKQRSFFENFRNSTINLILNSSQATNYGVHYFIDVNLKGTKLDTEDIFKGYLFSFGTDPRMQSAWISFKSNAVKLNNEIKYITDRTKIPDPEKEGPYPLTSMLEHYFYCDLYRNEDYQSIQFDSNFLINETEIGGDLLYNGTHLVEAINNPSYLINSLEKLTEILEFFIDIVSSRGVTTQFSNFYREMGIDDTEVQIMQSILRSLLIDPHVLVKALLIKYALLVKSSSEGLTREQKRNRAKTLYNVFVLSVLFILFEYKKGKDRFVDILKKDEWSNPVLKEIETYLDPLQHTDSRIQAAFKFASNTDDDTQLNNQFRAKSLAIIFNFLCKRTIDERNTVIDIIPHQGNSFLSFIKDTERFSIEHLIIPKSGQWEIGLTGGGEYIYSFANDIKKYKDKIFNFVFIPGQLNNNNLDDYCLPQKINIINENINNIECEYSKFVLENIEKILLEEMSNELQYDSEENSRNSIRLFFEEKFKELYLKYGKSMLINIQKRLLDEDRITQNQI